MERIDAGGLKVAKVLHGFVEQEALPGSGVTGDRFWSGFGAIIAKAGPRNRELLARRDQLQQQIDSWYAQHRETGIDPARYEAFLREIGYIVPEPATFAVSTGKVDDEIARIAGPQLVVPITNARYALNAANARWGSLYDALYGTDAIAETDGAERGRGYNPVRGERVVARARQLLDEAIPLSGGKHADATEYAVAAGKLAVTLKKGNTVGLADPTALAGYTGDAAAPSGLLFRHNGLHLEIVIDRTHAIGKTDPAGVADVLMEAAVSTIMDCEDSVATVDADDKVEAYRNWLGLMRGTLTASFAKDGRTMERRLSPDRTYTTP